MSMISLGSTNQYKSLFGGNKTVIAALAVLFLSACGGGGGSDTPTTPAPAPEVVPVTPPATIDLPAEFTDYLTGLADGIVIPAYQSMQASANDLITATSTFCALSSPTVTQLDTVRDKWIVLNLDWQQVQWVKVGPVVSQNRLFRIQFWPDNNDAVSRGVSNLLLQSSTVSADDVASQNVGGQGLPALELLLFPSTENENLIQAENKDKRCEVATAISQNLVNITTDINTEWSATGGNYRNQLITGTGEFTSITDAVEELTTNWLEALEIVKDEKMLLPLGSESPGNVGIAENTLSDQSLASIEANLQSFVDLYSNGDNKGFDSILTNTLDQDAINTQMLTAINAMLIRIKQINQDYDSYSAVLASEQGRQQIDALIEEIRVTRDHLSTGFIQALDINIGFNSNDGD
jgi:hypothetical protein